MIIQSRPYKPQACCERCVFGSGEHAMFCVHRPRDFFAEDYPLVEWELDHNWDLPDDWPVELRD